jgi:Ca2+-dependent lipid-binding protein
MSALRFSAMNLGPEPPLVAGVKLHETGDDEVMLDLDLMLAQST